MNEQTSSLSAVDIEQLLKFLPHRYPFLLVDRIIEIDGDNSGIGIKNVTVNEPQFMGHFPEHPIMPGVLIVEGIAQTAGALCIAAMPEQTTKALVYFMTIDKTKFRKPVVPGDQLRYHVQKIKHRGNIWKFAAEAKVDGVKVAETEISAMIVKPEAS